MYKYIALITIFISVLSLQQVYAQTACAAQANFDGCKEIQGKVLTNCGPVDYSCQCNAQRLILQCYDLCPSYASEATIQKSQVLGICAAVPSSATSSLPIASATMSNVAAVASNTPASSNPASTSASASASSSVNNKNSSSAAHIYPTYALLMICAIIGLLQL